MVAALVVAGLLPFLQAGLALRDGFHPVGDNALIALRARGVLAHPPLLGQPDSADTLGAGKESAHPGPIESYLLSPFVLALGSRFGLSLGAAAINAGSLVAALFLAYRRGGPRLLALLAVGLALLVRSVGPGFLHDPINSDIATLALVPLGLAAWSLLQEDLAVAPLFTYLASLVLQVHLANGPWGFAAVVVAVVGLVRAVRRGVRPDDRRWLLAALGIGFLAWLPPLLAELTRSSSNVGAIWASGTEDRGRIGLSFAIGRAANSIGVVDLPVFARGAGHLAPPGKVPALALFLDVTVLAVALVLGRWLTEHGRRAAARLIWVCVVLLVTATVVNAGLPFLGVIRPEHARWSWAIGVLLWSALLWAGPFALPADVRRRFERPMTVGLLVAALVVAGSTLRAPTLRRDSGVWAMARIEGFSAAIDEALPPGSYHVTPIGSASFLTVTPAVVLELEERGRHLYIDPSVFSRGYDDGHLFDHQEVAGDLLIVEVTPATASEVPAGARLLATDDPPAGSADARLAAYLVDR